MNLLLVTQFFKPETFIINDLVLEMEKLEHKITVFTGKPNYPDGDIYPGFRQWGIQREIYGQNIEVIRVPLIPRRQGRTINLLLNYLSYMIFGSLLAPWLLRGKKFDNILVFATSPITAAVPAIVIKLFKRTHLSVWVLDLWPESLMVTGFIKNKFLLSIVKFFVWGIYRFTDLILVPSKAFVEPIKKIDRKAQLCYYPNSFRKTEAALLIKTLPDQAEKILSENFCVVFAGNIGTAQSVETIVKAAEILKNTPKLKFVFVGSGLRLSWIEQEKKRLNLENVECIGRFDISFMPAIYSKSKVMLLTLNADEILQYTLPWKIQSYMAAGKPVIGAIDGEGARVIEDAKCGLVGAAENAQALADNVKAMMAMPIEQLNDLGRNGLQYFEKHFEMESQAQSLVKILKEYRSERK